MSKINSVCKKYTISKFTFVREEAIIDIYPRSLSFVEVVNWIHPESMGCDREEGVIPADNLMDLLNKVGLKVIQA